MAIQRCPKCKKESFSWSIDEEESLHTKWFCRSCNYIAFENERMERECKNCGKVTDSYLIDDESEYWWCSGCGRSLLYVFLIIGLTSCINGKSQNTDEIQIQWVDGLDGDFSFKDNWSYPEGVYRNRFGQLSCDGLCPPEIDDMFDDERRIIPDSMKSFYSLVDTTHLYHSISSEARTYEWAGTDFISVRRIHKHTVICFTMNNAATHSSLNLLITANAVRPTIELNSITSTGIKTFRCTDGKILIDSKLWEKGLLKAVFDFEFEHKEDSGEPIYWKGKIYAKIEDFNLILTE